MWSIRCFLVNPARYEPPYISARAAVILWTLYFIYQDHGASALLVGPENVAAVTGEPVTFGCKTDSTSSLRWAFILNGQKDEIILTREGRIFPKFQTQYYINSTNGRFDLGINRTNASDAGRYNCLELSTSSTASAELIVIEYTRDCSATYNETSASVLCNVSFTGAIVPETELILGGSALKIFQPHGSAKQLSVSTTVDRSSPSFVCTISFSENGTRQANLLPELVNAVPGTVAQNTPSYSDRIACRLSPANGGLDLKRYTSVAVLMSSVYLQYLLQRL